MDYDGKWGREVAARAKLRRERLDDDEWLEGLRQVAERAESVIPGPWAVSEANFIVYDFLNGDPETGKAVAEVDCYNEHVDIKTAHIAAFDPAMCLRLLDLARKGLEASK